MLTTVVLLSCSESAERAPPAADERASLAPVASDASAPAAPDASARFHLDPVDPFGRNRRPPRERGLSRPIELVLRSSPPGATVAIDGETVGVTPAVWLGTADGRVRDFTFVLTGHALARYRFAPTQSGVVHGRLKRLSAGTTDAGPTSR